MAKKMTKQEYDAWRSQHAGKNQFEIFHKDGGRVVVDFTFWAATCEDASLGVYVFNSSEDISHLASLFSNIFKKNKIVQAKIFYILLVFGLSYLVCSFVYDFLYMIK